MVVSWRTSLLGLLYVAASDCFSILPVSSSSFRQANHANNLPIGVSASSALLTQRHMALVPLSVDDLERIISSSGKPTGEQYATYWGRTTKEKFGRFMESMTVTLLGVSFSYCLSFVLGGFVATILGGLFAFWAVLSPEFKAYQRNWEFLGGRQLVDLDQVMALNVDPERAGLYGALFLGHLADVCVVEESDSLANEEYDLSEFADYTMETDELDRYTGQPYLLRVQCRDRQGRTLQIHTRLSEEYLQLHPGMPATALLLSTSPKFTKLAALTDILALPTADNVDQDCGCWIGDYPYLNRPEVEALLAEDDDLWDALQDEAVPFDTIDTTYGTRTSPDLGNEDPFYDSDSATTNSDSLSRLVPVSRRSRR
jgi:hypothetical protein